MLPLLYCEVHTECNLNDCSSCKISKIMFSPQKNPHVYQRYFRTVCFRVADVIRFERFFYSKRFFLGRRKAALYCFYFHRKCPERPERCLDIYIYIYICQQHGGRKVGT